MIFLDTLNLLPIKLSKKLSEANMKVKTTNYLLNLILITGIWANGISLSHADSDLFPAYENAPALQSYVSGGTFNNTYYISPKGNDTTGNGSINNPWLSFNGATSGGSGTPVSAGDIIYARGGTYPTHTKAYWKKAYYALERSGTATDYIVITNYPGETPQFTGGENMPSFSIHGKYVVINGLTFIDGGNFGINRTSNVVIQNLTFSVCADGWGDQNLGTCIGLGDYVDQIVIRNNYFGPSSSEHAIKSYTSESVTSNVKVLYNRFHGITVGYGVISHKGVAQNWEYAYNRFQDCSIAIGYGVVYNAGINSGSNIHHNVFDNVQAVISRIASVTKELRNFQVYNNIVLNSGTLLRLDCNSGGYDCLNTGVDAIGEFYNNVAYGVGDLIDPRNTTGFTNYPNYWNHNAYRSSSNRSTAENQNSLASSAWQGNSRLIPQVSGNDDDILVTGNSGNRFYYVTDNSPLRGAGRYGDNIGGFTWGDVSARPMPPTWN